LIEESNIMRMNFSQIT